MMKIRGKDLSQMISNRNENNENVPILFNRETDEIDEIERIPRLTTPNIRDYFQNSDDIREVNVGYIDSVKSASNVRFLSLNPHGFRPFDQRKAIMMQQAIQHLSIDVVLLQETNTKWTSSNISKFERNIRAIDRESVIFTVDSKEWDVTPTDYLPGGICSVFLSKCSPLIDSKRVVKGRLGNWMAISLVNKGKRLEIINIYRLPSSSSYGVKCSLTQYNRIDGNISSPTVYRKELFEEIKKHIRDNQDITDIIIGGDYNQNIGDKEIKKFHEEIGVHNIHQIVNNVEIEQMCKTYIHGSSPIDAVYASNGIMDYVDGCKILPNNEIIEADHRSYLIDIALDEYFEDEFGEWDEVNKVILNPSRRSHREIFVTEIERQLEIYLLENELERMNRDCLNEEIEKIDELITQIFREATKKVEGIRRNIPYSHEKEKVRSKVLYSKMKLRELQGKVVDIDLMNSRKQKAEMNDEVIDTIQDAKEWVEKAKELWENVIKNGKEMREKELLDYHHEEILGDDQEIIKKKKRILAGIKKKLRRDHTFHYLSRHVGKGKRETMKRLQIPSSDGSEDEYVIDREKMENKIMEYNRSHFKKAHNSKVFNDKIYKELRNDNVRDKILNGTLQREECDDDNVYEFLKLLNQNGRNNYRRCRKEINYHDWEKVVKQSKRNSASSIFSSRTYAVYKCALNSERMTNILVSFYNLIIKRGYFPRRWLNILDVMIGKGKGMLLGKLRIITLIEADLQYVMRIYLGDDEEEIIENDCRFSKANYGSRRNYSIETALLEKRLIFDNSMLSGKETIYTITDLQACYDRQLAEIGSIVEESAGRDRAAVKLMSKVIPNWRHYIRTGYGISKSYYGGELDPLAGTGQGNRFSGDVCRDTSCLILKVIKNNNLGMTFQSRVFNESMQVAAVSYVDDNDLVSDGDNAAEKMNKGVNIFSSLYEATGGLVEENKSKVYSCQWKVLSGRKVIYNNKNKIRMQEIELKNIDCKKQELTLGVMMSPALIWDAQFVQMVNKMKDAIGSLKNTNIAVSTASMYYNMYLIKKVYYGGGIFTLNDRQEQILKTIYESVILNKLGLSEKFPRKVLYARKSALGVGLMAPRTIMSVLALKLYLSHQRGETRISRLININEDNARLYYGFAASIIDSKLEWNPGKCSWSDEIRLMLRSRNLEIINRINETKWITKNKTIMDYAIQYSNDLIIVEAINHVRLYKKMILPCELVGFRGNCKTREYREVHEPSSMRWKVKFESVIKPHKRLIEEWKKFMCWLENQEIDTIIDFEEKIETKYEVSANRKYVKINNEETEYYYAYVIRYGQVTYERIDQIEEQELRKTVAEMKPNKSMVIHCMFPPQHGESNINYDVPFNEQVTKSIEEGLAVAATDASVKEHCMGGWWIVTSKDKSFKIEKGIFSSNWEDNSSGCAEVIVLLELVTVLEKKGRHITQGEIAIGFDYKKAHSKIVKCLLKSNEYAKEAGGEIAMIKKLLAKIKFNVVMKLVKGHEKEIEQYQMQPLKHLIRECDLKANKEREDALNRDSATNIKYYGMYAMKKENVIFSRSIQESVRIIDAKMAEEEYGQEKMKYKYQFVDADARNAFNSKKVTASMMKCTHGFNHYGLRDSLINNNMIDVHCPRCQEVETWDHIIKCKETINLRKDFIKKLLLEMLKNKGTVDVNEIMSFGEDILVYLENDQEAEYETNQQYVGMTELFRGYVVKNWMEVNMNTKKYRYLNRILARECVHYYDRCWKHRNQIMHDPIKQKERMKRWYENEKERGRNSDSRQIRMYVEKNTLDVERCNSDTIKRWIMNMKTIEKKVEKIPANDIRRYMIL